MAGVIMAQLEMATMAAHFSVVLDRCVRDASFFTTCSCLFPWAYARSYCTAKPFQINTSQHPAGWKIL
jgi:hypothetical protein